MPEGMVCIVDDEEVNRELFSDILSSVGISHKCYASGQDFIDNFDPEQPGCILLDVRMPGMSGLELQRRLRDDGTPHPVIIVTAHGDVSVAIEAMKAGAFDFIEKPVRNQELLDIVQRAMERGRENSDNQSRQAELKTRYASLTPREKEVFQLVVDGEPNKRIAHDLSISIKTVELHRAKVMQKMDARPLADLIRTAISLQSLA